MARSRLRLAGLRPADLHPIYPAMVMGTGSLSTGALLLGMRRLSMVLFVIAIAALALFVVLGSIRVIRYRESLRDDARDPKTALALYTFVAALAVVGARGALDGHVELPALGLAVGLAGCAALAVPGLRMLQSHLPSPESATGNWQLPSVAIEALALLAALLALEARSDLSEAVAVALWLIGAIAYLAVVPAFVRRFRGRPTRPADLTPDFWTLMAVPSLIGLVATRLWLGSSTYAASSWLRSLYQPVAVLGLTISAVLAPIWIALQVWRLVRDPASRRYSPAWWGLVFPTAIVVVAAQVTSTTFGPGWLHEAARTGFWLVLAAWATVGLGLVRDLLRREAQEVSDG